MAVKKNNSSWCNTKTLKLKLKVWTWTVYLLFKLKSTLAKSQKWCHCLNTSGFDAVRSEKNSHTQTLYGNTAKVTKTKKLLSHFAARHFDFTHISQAAVEDI